MASIEDLRQIVGGVLQLGARTNGLNEHTGLLGNIPEFDSMAVVTVLTTIEDHYGIVIDDDEISAEIFETLGSLLGFVNSKL